MFVSACPRTGELSAYPATAQAALREGLRRARQGGSAVSVALGASCFEATVTLLPCGRHRQTTPARAGKPAGSRSVACAEGAVVAVFRADGRWTLHRPKGDALQVARARPDVPTEVIWEWSAAASLADSREPDWLPYADAAQQLLEAALEASSRTTTPQTVELDVGQSRKCVVVHPSHAFFEQHDAFTHRRRWARRVCVTAAARAAKRAALRAAASAVAADVCAVCTDEFADTPDWPVTTTACGHAFHGCCLDACRARGSERCPMCRSDL